MPPAAAPPAAGARPRVDRLTVLNWLAFLAILGTTLGEGCAMQAARRRQEREAREACEAAASGVALALGAPPAAGPAGASTAGRAPAGCPR
jgi:hypothetical protein